MDIQTLSEVVKNVGLPGAILIWVIWRLDKFLTNLTQRLGIFNDEFRDIFLALNGIVEELRQINIKVDPTKKD